MATSIAPFRLRKYHWLAVIPPIGMLAGVPFVNRVHTLVLGLPVLLSWIVGWVILASACMALLYALDHRAAPEPGERQ